MAARLLSGSAAPHFPEFATALQHAITPTSVECLARDGYVVVDGALEKALAGADFCGLRGCLSPSWRL